MASKGNVKLVTTPVKKGAKVAKVTKVAKVVIVKTEWNAHIVDKLEKGCVKVLKANDVATTTLVVPGAVEVPFAIHAYSKYANDADAFIALACVIQGDTPHFDYVCQSITQGITILNSTLPVPVIYGVLTVNNDQQANERIGGLHGHKGEEAALTALKMIALNKSLIPSYDELPF